MSGPPTVSIDSIKAFSAAAFGVRVIDVVSMRRDRPAVDARHVAMYLARHLTPFSLKQIGGFFEDRDRTTVLHAISRIENLMDRDGHMAGVVAGVWHSLLPGRPLT